MEKWNTIVKVSCAGLETMNRSTLFYLKKDFEEVLLSMAQKLVITGELNFRECWKEGEYVIRGYAQQTGDPLILENKSPLYNAGVQNGLEEYCSGMSWACCNWKPNL